MQIEAPSFADRSERGKLEVTGPQRAWFLDQILTQSFEGIAPGEARDTAMLTVHGRTIAYMEALAADGAILCHYEPDLAATVPEALQRYVFATEVELTDATDRYALILVTGAGWRAAAVDVPTRVRVHPTRSLGVDAAYLWVEIEAHADIVAQLAARGLEPIDEAQLETVRIANGVPRWGYEIDDKTFPQEVGIDAYAVHYDKGCYLGQEAMAKIHFRGKVNRRLVRVMGTDKLRARVDVTLDDTKIGTLTSAAGTRGLALVKHTVEPESVLDADGNRVIVID